MNKHKSDKVSQGKINLHNKAGTAPQVPLVKSSQHNQYR